MVVSEGERTVIVIGRGHGGTRVAAQLLAECGVNLGRTPRSGSWDLVLPELYDLARLACRHIRLVGGEQAVEFSPELFAEPPPEASRLVQAYAQAGGLADASGLRGWKLPETVFAFPWLLRILPRARFVLWGRDPRDAILRAHGTDDLGTWGVQNWPGCIPQINQRLLSWIVQTELMLRAELAPERLFLTGLTRWARDPDVEGARLAAFIGGPTPRLRPVPGVVGQYATRHDVLRSADPALLARACALQTRWLERCDQAAIPTRPEGA
jgi:hypothetical protein